MRFLIVLADSSFATYVVAHCITMDSAYEHCVLSSAAFLVAPRAVPPCALLHCCAHAAMHTRHVST